MNKKYWQKFYRKNSSRSDISNSSSFAKFCYKNFLNEKTKTIVELGCGNARDAKFFAQDYFVYALDQIIEQKILNSNKNSKLNLVEQDFVHTEFNFNEKVDVFYSRFTIHSITEDEQYKLLPKVYNHLNNNGLFCIEARTTKDSKFGVGKHISDTTYFNDNHNRRFINSQDFLNQTLSLGFKLRYFNEQDNLSVCKKDNPVLMRVILNK